MSIITISRGTFSGGKRLAECLADRLGYPCLSREVIAEAAAVYGVSQVELGAALSQPPSFWDRFRRDRDRYLAYIRAVLCQRAKVGNLIYHGHAGHHLLAGVRHVIRVRVVADLSYRIHAAMAQCNMTSGQAEAYINKVDEDRRKWTRFLYGVAWEDASNYDVVLNLEYLGAAGACEVVVRMTELEQFEQTEQSQTAMQNLAVASLVTAALARDQRTRDSDFRVQADAGTVTIEGMVRMAATVGEAAEVASATEGVRAVVNHVVTATLAL
ncbi:MAG: cytidylate kinase family protein [Acidobacteria bacterium]|nr:cytidylate kinase family protein [Acidobacteriota bacterium]